MRKFFSLLVVACLLVVTACSGSGGGAATAPADDGVLERLGFAGLSGKDIVAQLDASTDQRPLAFAASVRPTGLLLADEQGETVVPLPEDEFYVSVAPYVSNTHPCHFHSLATCNGELKETPVAVKITTAEGDVLVNEQTTTYAGNGFIGYWLPRGVTGTIEVTLADGRSGAVDFSTVGDEDATCITTLQLS
ncbi:CueP family metal-binding protein [Propionibacteriaceae bacterium Y1923]